MRRHLATLAAVCFTLGGPAAAQDGAFAPVVDALEDRDWDAARALARPLGETAQALVAWERLRAGAGTFADYRAFVAAHPDWPGLDRLREAGEAAIPGDADPEAVLAYFEEVGPQSGAGVVRQARALEALGRGEEAEAAVIDAWLTLGLDDRGQAAILKAYGALLLPYHAARAEAMLWRWRHSDTERLLGLLQPDERALAEARIALLRGSRDAPARVAAVPGVLAGHPGLAHDRFNRMASDGDYTDATALLKQRSTSVDALGDPFRWAGWRETLARWAMREGRPEEAYGLAARHFLTEGAAYAELEWLAGYLALTYLEGPSTALFHFDRMAAAVSGPISTARAHYWRGRALEALGDPEAAADAFGRAALQQTAFYGLLAADRLGLPLDPDIASAPELPDWEGAAVRQTALGQAAELLLDGGDRGAAVLFIFALAETLDRPGLGALGDWLLDRDETWLALLVGKTAAARGELIPALYHPLHAMAERDWPVETALALAVARQESEFNATVGSPVGALGLMQLMPGTAEEVATDLGLPYSRPRLTADWVYNATLGTRYLELLRDRFGDSPVLIAAGYNAGPGRPRTWITQRGDPRRGEIDIVDWIEHIPFEETRNYVMRVSEALPIYRARLSGGAVGAVQFRALLEGVPPPRLRPLVRRVTTTVTSTSSTDPAAPLPAPPAPGVRPLARPGG